ncbi:helix-turn-helix domain-containing protein [Aliiglaciecola sp. CAU 1673]|uniref:helix-turn-helix domain-containing protein n=1 Tax=Aliiglaciecola sp. CAU 1673 TaxID=3032595 RepID=UPI0023DBCE48|nr:helix-turn-helix domain-containing protein [Aliiglaciecola sp. CAU 1673]MDF2178171.1 helix-turn-helix domain-containing protein [Aliiglaciecola sp. CAU 1673]
MMSIDFAYSLLLLIALAVMVAQAFFRPLRIEHILVAVLCGSLSMVALQNLTADSIGPYQYLFALGTCATCNCVWLVSRALFQGSKSITAGHYLFAGSIAILVIISRSLDLFVSVEWLSPGAVDWLKRSVGEVTQLLSSTVLALAFWEAIRGYSSSSKASRYQRTLFAATFFAGVFSCTVVADGILSGADSLAARPWLVVLSALAIIISTFVVVIWQHLERKAQMDAQNEMPEASDCSQDSALLTRIEELMQREKMYLQQELKIIDLANALGVSEYKISRAIRNLTPSPNFNHYVNSYRITHAKQLLTEKDSHRWTVLVVSLESGFASQAPFNRAFKAFEGCTPNQYRLKHQTEGARQALSSAS